MGVVPAGVKKETFLLQQKEEREMMTILHCHCLRDRQRQFMGGRVFIHPNKAKRVFRHCDNPSTSIMNSIWV